MKGNIVVTLGKPELKEFKTDKNIQIYSFLGPEKQGEFFNRAKVVVARSGYTTIMDLAELGKKKVLLIPTPGQTEQEYLADYYEKEGYLHHVHQSNIHLEKDIAKAYSFIGLPCPWKTEKSVKRFMKIIGDFERSRKRGS